MKFFHTMGRRIAAYIIFAGLLPLAGLRAQGITVKEGGEITYQAKRLVGELENYLNTISNADLGETDIQSIIEGSYADPANRIFYNDKVVIEDDVDPAAGPGKTRDFEVSKYLRNFDLMYTKSASNSVTFSNVTTSSLKKKEFCYIKVYFESLFANSHRSQKTPYTLRKRVAMVRADKDGKKWKTYLIGVRFYTEEDPKKAALNDVQLIDDAATASTGALSRGQATEPSDEAHLQALSEEEKKTREKEYSQAVSQGREAEARQDYTAALDNYKAARELFSRLEVVKKIIELERVVAAQNNWELLLSQADLAAKQREYGKAIELYNKVLRIKPDQTGVLDKIRELSQRVEFVSVVRNLYGQGKYEEALKESRRRVKKEEDKSTYPELFLLRGRCYVALNKYTDAAEEYDQSISYAPNYLEARIARAELYERRSEWAKAIAEYEVILQSIAPKEAAYYAKKAALEVKANDARAAINDYEKAIQFSLSNPLYYYERGMVYYSLEDFDKARLSFDSAIRVDPTFVRAYFQRAKLHLQANRLREAGEDFTKARQLGMDQAQLNEVQQIAQQYYRTGLTRGEQQQYEEAIRLFDQTLLLKPDYAEAWYGKGEALLQRKNYAAARENFSKAIVYHANYPEAYYQRGRSELFLEDFAASLRDFQKAASLKPEYAEAWLGAGRVQMQTKEFAAAQTTFEKVIPMLEKQKKAASRSAQDGFEEKLAESYNLLGRCQYETKRYKEALETLKTSLDYRRDRAETYYNRGLAYYELSNLTRAVEDFNTCLAKDPEMYDAIFARAKAYELAGKYDKAVSDYSKVLAGKELPISKEALYRRGLSNNKQRYYDAALRDYEAYIRKYPKEVNYRIYNELGFLYLDTYKPNMALDKFRQAHESNLLNPIAMYGLGFAYAQLAKVPQSVQWLEEALKANPQEWKNLKKDNYLTNLKNNYFFIKLKKQYKL